MKTYRTNVILKERLQGRLYTIGQMEVTVKANTPSEARLKATGAARKRLHMTVEFNEIIPW